MAPKLMVFPKRTVWKWIAFNVLVAIVVSVTLFTGHHRADSVVTSPRSKYAVYSCSTPTKVLRTFDYAFYLPLTALAWERLGFKSVVVIVGSRPEWDGHPVLSHVLDFLSQRNATIIFLDAPMPQRITVSQTVRLLASQLPDFPASAQDYLITTDADLWPLKSLKVELPSDYELLLTHSHCCGNFSHHGREYRMLPMSYIGASVSLWRRIIGSDVIHSTEDVLKYLEIEFGSKVRETGDVERDSNRWYFDQFMASIKIDDWTRSNGGDKVLEVSGETFERLDRSRWDYFPSYHKLRQEFDTFDDAHLPLCGYKTFTWSSFRALLRLMYQEDNMMTDKIRWANQYATLFRKKMSRLEFI